MTKENEDIFSAISNLEFRSWHSLPDGLTYSEFLERFPKHKNNYGLGVLGAKKIKTKYTIHKVVGYKLNIEAWFSGNELKLLILNYPEIMYEHNSIWNFLGEPEIKLDYYLDVMQVKQGVWVFAMQGIVLFLDVGLTKIMKIGLFKSCSLQHYLDQLHFDEEIVE